MACYQFLCSPRRSAFIFSPLTAVGRDVGRRANGYVDWGLIPGAPHSECIVKKNPKVAQKISKVILAKDTSAGTHCAQLVAATVCHCLRAGELGIRLNFMQILRLFPVCIPSAEALGLIRTTYGKWMPDAAPGAGGKSVAMFGAEAGSAQEVGAGLKAGLKRGVSGVRD